RLQCRVRQPPRDQKPFERTRAVGSSSPRLLFLRGLPAVPPLLQEPSLYAHADPSLSRDPWTRPARPATWFFAHVRRKRRALVRQEARRVRDPPTGRRVPGSRTLPPEILKVASGRHLP